LSKSCAYYKKHRNNCDENRKYATTQKEIKSLVGADKKENTNCLILNFDKFTDYSKILKEYRKKHKITQVELAEMLNVPHPTLKCWEQKIAKPPYHTWRSHKHLFNDVIDFS